MKNILKGYTLIALVVVAFNVYELIIQKVSMKSGIIFIIEGLLGLLLIYIPSILKKLLKELACTSSLILNIMINCCILVVQSY